MTESRTPVKLQDVAAACGTSVATVSYALNNTGAVSAEMRERILATAQRMGYRRNRLARGLARGRSQMVGVLIPLMEEEYYTRLLYGIRAACGRHETQILLAPTDEHGDSHAEQIDRLLDHRVDGVIALSITPQTGEWLQKAEAARTPCVILDDHSLGDRTDCIVSDDIAGMAAAVRHLIERGHRRIAHLRGDPFFTTGQDRCAGVQQAMEAAGLPIDPARILGSLYNYEEAAENTRRLLAQPEPPTAFVTANDYMAEAALDVLRENGVSVPEQASVIGYGDVRIAHSLGLTTTRQDTEALSAAAVERLFARLDGLDEPPGVQRLPVVFRERRTTGPCRSA